ncbi:hypothetical protein H5410_061723 [Solanum commersonii]|uniref:Uncharacterized protein n=1 Tax=Solanum commersonii TaxID=4109 RepID=A0A9J5W8N6_SOLCO|nr:hypothetical protein H5410_061723 [Solanum commersonii]
MKQLRKNERKMELKQARRNSMSSGGDSDRHREQIVSASVMILIYLLFRLVWRIIGNIILITVDQSVLPLLHRHSLHGSRRTYLYRLFVDHDPYRQVGY